MDGKYLVLQQTRKAGELKITVPEQKRRVATVIKKRGRFQLKHPMTSVEHARAVSTLLASINGHIPMEAA